jgi:hypothetical protein
VLEEKQECINGHIICASGGKSYAAGIFKK